jgi:DNA-binding MarR family transcriptional regulator
MVLGVQTKALSTTQAGGATRSGSAEGAAAGMAHALLQLQRLRAELLGMAKVGDADWNMLLDLYLNDQRGRRVYISSLCMASGVPQSSALRHINMLETQGLVSIQADDCDKRRRWVTLTAGARARLDEYLARAIEVADNRRR